MGGAFSRKQERRILILGLDNAGKTTWVKRLNREGEVEQTIPTIGFNVEQVKIRNFNLNMWDVGGQDNIRHLWRHYYPGTNALIFVVDSIDSQRIEEAASILHNVAGDEELQESVVMVLANKQDQEGAMTPGELTSKMGLARLKQSWTVMAVSAKTGQGCDECMLWLRDNLKKK